MFKVLIKILIILSSLSAICLAQVQCTVGVGGTYSKIQDALNGCNGGAGSIQLVLNGTFIENWSVSTNITNVTFTTAQFISGLAPAWPKPGNLTAVVNGFNFTVNCTTTQIFFQGINFDGGSVGAPFFQTPLINNNLTIDRCLISNYTGNITIQTSPCKRYVGFTSVNTRYHQIWGSALYIEGAEDITMDSNVLDQCGGYNNYSCVYTKPSFVSQGIYYWFNNSHWLITDAQPPSCTYAADQNNMTQCYNGTLQCYDIVATAQIYPNCAKQNITYINEKTGLTGIMLDYPRKCRIYRPCVCQNLQFINLNTSATQVFPIGDIYYYTGLRLNCTVANSTTSLNDSLYEFVTSLAGSAGMGSLPPVNDTSMGWSLAPNIYLTGNIGTNSSKANCTCAPPNTSLTLADLNIPCDYSLGNASNTGPGTNRTGIPLRCNNGTVQNCSLEFLSCFKMSLSELENDQIVYPSTASATSSGGSNDMFYICNTTTNLLYPISHYPGNQTLPSDAVLCTIVSELVFPPATPITIIGEYMCIGMFPENSTFTVLLSNLDQDIIEEICNDTALFPPNTTDCGDTHNNNITQVNQTSYCLVPHQNQDRTPCTNRTLIQQNVMLVQVCSPYRCPANYTVNCTYSYLDIIHNTTVSVLYSYNYTSYDGINLTNSTTFSNGTALCPNFNYTPNYDNFTIDVCTNQSATPGYELTNGTNSSFCGSVDHGEQVCCFNSSTVAHGRGGCGIMVCVIPIVTLVNTKATLVPAFPYNQTSSCGANYTCNTLNYTNCSCILDQIVGCLTPYVPGSRSAAFHWDNIRNETSFMVVTQNRCQQLPTGLILDRTTEWIIDNTSIEVVGFSDEQARLRNIINQNNFGITGLVHDTQYGLFGDQLNLASYRTVCDGACPQDFTTIDSFDCVVDSSTPQPQINKTYQTIQLAIDGDCTNILVNSEENFYTDQIIFRNNIQRLYSFNGACVLNYGHQIQVSQLEIKGMCFIHPGDQSVEVFTLTQDMDYFHILNCAFDGGGVRGAGIMSLGSTQRITELVINQTNFNNWNYATFILWNIENLWVSHNLFTFCTGRVVDIVYDGVFRVHDNTGLNVRGVGDSGHVAMFRFSGRDSNFEWLSSGNGNAACSSDAINNYGFSCIFFNNVIINDVTADDLSDVCFTIIGGGITYDQIFDNFCNKAITGLQVREVENITSHTIQYLLAQNSGIRPSRSVTTGNTNDVFDFVYDIYQESEEFLFFQPFTTYQCVFPCGFSSLVFPVCVVNPNWDVGYIGELGVGGGPYAPFGNENFTNYGFGYFHNASHAFLYCDLNRTNAATGKNEIPIYFTGDRGGRMFRDAFDVIEDGMSMYGILLPNETNVCPDCFPRSDIHGNGYRILANDFTICNMSFTLDRLFMGYGINMITTNPRLVPVYSINATNNSYNGANLTQPGQIRLLNLIVGFDEQVYSASKTVSGGGTPPMFALVPNSTVIVRSSVFTGFPSYNSSLNQSATNYPFVDPLFVWCLNEEEPALCSVFIDDNVFDNVPRRAVEVRYAYNTTILRNVITNLGGLSPGNGAGFFVNGNRVVPSVLYYQDNIITNDNPILFDRTASKINPGWYAHVVLRGYNGGLMCIYNNSISGGAIGMRIAGSAYNVTLSCINVTDDPPQFYDELDPLRQILFYNPNITGYVQCLVYGEVYQDWFKTWLTCCPPVYNGTQVVVNASCPPANPQSCNVSLTDPAYVPTHPWWDKFVFRDVNRAIEKCQVPNRSVRVLPNYPPENYVLTFNPMFIGNETNCPRNITTVFNSTTNTTQFNSGIMQVVYAEQNDSTNPVIIEGCNHTLAMCNVQFANFILMHVCNNTEDPTWNTSVPIPPNPEQLPVLQLFNNSFAGEFFNVSAIAGIADNGLQIGSQGGGTGKKVFYKAIQTANDIFAPDNGNTFQNYTSSSWVNLRGRSCETNITVIFNLWDTCPGNCFNITQVGGMQFDYNTAVDSAGIDLDKNAVFYVNVCQPTAPVKYQLLGRYNSFINTTNYAPLNDTAGGGYISFLWFDPVPTNFMTVEIEENTGTVIGVCLREDNRPDDNTNSVLDPQWEARQIDLYEHNLFCRGEHYDTRYLNGPEFDFVVDTDHVLYRRYFCNDGCPKVNETQLSIVLGIIAILIAMIVFCCLFYFFTKGRPWMYFSGTLGKYIPSNPFRWASYGVIPGDDIMRASERRQQIHRDRMARGGGV